MRFRRSFLSPDTRHQPAVGRHRSLRRLVPDEMDLPDRAAIPPRPPHADFANEPNAPPMNPEDEIFVDVIALPPTERNAFLDQACAGEPALRNRIDALLANYNAAAGFLEKFPFDIPRVKLSEKPGDVIGRYTLQRVIGEGGCGVVYLAEQKQPVRRQVALKVIKLGMDTREVIARFEAERQAVAMMNHPDIAQVLDAGATDSGRPFFVMELVEGTPITHFCAEHRLPLAARLELFARTCLAVQHAHQKGIIHRDLKPSNILVKMHDGAPIPKVIDFGIAKATRGRLTDQTLHTGVGQFIGTPAYMSPEHADLRDLDIDTRSDIYSLGVLLYELLTGQPPFDPHTLAQSGIAEIVRLIRDVEPVRPSLRVTTSDKAKTPSAEGTPSADSATFPASDLRGDLDWIVMRCLEKNRDRRYASMQELADDVRRHLRREPIEARPASTAYRARKFVDRHRVACASAAAIAAALIIGTVVSLNQAVRATRAEHIAMAERDAANRARTDAQRRQEQAEDLLTFMLGDFRTELQKIGRLQLLDTVGRKAMDYFGALDSRDLTDTALARQATALTQIGETRMDQARYDEADAAFTTAYERAAALATRHPQNGDILFERAQAEFWIGYVAMKRGDRVANRDWFTRYLKSAVTLVALEGASPRAQLELIYGHHNLAVLDFENGQLASAKQGFLAEKIATAKLLATDPANLSLHFRMAEVASWLGSVAERQGDYPEALQQFVALSRGIEDLVSREPTVPKWQWRLANTMAFIGDIQVLQGRREAAARTFARGETLLVPLVTGDPANRKWLQSQLNLRLKQASLLLADGATADLRRTREQLETLVAAEPTSRVFKLTLATALRMEALQEFQSQSSDAASTIQRALITGGALVEDGRADHKAIGEYSQACILAGRIAAADGEPNQAREHWHRARAMLAPQLTGSHDWRMLDPAAQAYLLLGQPSDARPLLTQLRSFDYHPLDPLAASTLDAVYSTRNP